MPSKSTSTSAKKTRSTRQRKKRSSTNTLGLWIIGVSAVIVLLVVVAVVVSNRPVSTGTVALPDLPPNWVNRATLGSPDAVVTVQAWEDFLCPHCREWTSQVEPQLIQDYVKTGKIKFEFHSFPLQGFEPGSDLAAMAAQCAADQGGFWPYHDKLFQSQDRGQAGYTIDALVQYADQLNLNGNQLLQCMSSQKYRKYVDDSVSQATSLNLNSTPSILVNGKFIQNPFDYNALKADIDSLVSAAGGGTNTGTNTVTNTTTTTNTAAGK